MNKKIAYTTGILFFLGLLIYFTDSTDNIFNKLQQSQAKGDIHIGVMESSEISENFLKGVQLAVEKVNAKGGVKNRKIVPIIRDDKGYEQTGMTIAAEFSADPSLLAVVGHSMFDVTIAASLIYESNNLVFITTRGTSPELTLGKFVFRNIPSDKQIVNQTVLFLKRNDKRKIIIVYEKSFKHLVVFFQEKAIYKNIYIISSLAFSSFDHDYKKILLDLKNNYDVDCIFIAGNLKDAAFFIKQARAMGITHSIISGFELDSSHLKSIAGKDSEKVIVPTYFYDQSFDDQALEFNDSFKSKYGFVPDKRAASGYDAIMLLAHVITKSRSMDPIEIKENLTNVKNWKSVYGEYSFNSRGDIDFVSSDDRGKSKLTSGSIVFKKMTKNGFQYLEKEMYSKVFLYNYDVKKTLRIPMKKINFEFDPGLVSEQSDIEICEQLFLGLTDFDPNTYEAVPELAKEWTVSGDGTMYTFYLRDDVLWTDGKRLNAYDVEYAIRRNILLNHSPAKNRFNIIKNASPIIKGTIKDLNKLGVKAINRYTVVFQLEHPATYFPVLAGLPCFRPLPRHIIEKYRYDWTEMDRIEINGPYKIALMEKENLLVLFKNLEYFDANKVSIPEIRYFKVHNSKLGLKMYMNNELDIMGGSFLPIPIKNDVRIQSDPILKKEYTESLLASTFAYVFRTLHYPVNDPMVRKAISAAIPRKYILKSLNVKGEAATTWVSPPSFGAIESEEGVGISFDPLQAKEWLAEAGFPNGNGFPAINLMYYDSSNKTKIAKAVKTSLKHYLNIELKLFPMTWDEYKKIFINPTQFLEQQDKIPHMFQISFTLDYPDSNNFFEILQEVELWTLTEWDNEEFEKLIKIAEHETVQDKRKRMYKRAEQILCEEQAVVIPMFFLNNPYLIKQRLKGWYSMLYGGQHIRNWYLEDK